MENYIQLNRQFIPVPKNQEEAIENDTLAAWGYLTSKTWDDLINEFRCVILAEAGAGKTEEFRQYADTLAKKGKPAFFIRIEDIETDFYNAFEIGKEDQFHTWLQSADEAWFFLDSVDEARLESTRAFEKAIHRFASGIKNGVHRAHIYLSGRPYAWRPKEDRMLLDGIFLPAMQQEENTTEDLQDKPPSALSIYVMRPLDHERVQHFCISRSAKQVDHLLQEIERHNLWNLAERPFDLEGILAKWDDDSSLGSRLDLLRHNIKNRLSDTHNTNRAQQQPLNLELAQEGARRLAAAVVLTGRVGINVPDATQNKPGIDAESILYDWKPENVRALLERGLFNDVIYGAVRFRHRDVRELLAADWFEQLLKSGNSRAMVEALFFREQYGEKIITPRLRPILPWLILFDEEIRQRAIEIHAGIAIEGGDPSQLPLIERKRILTDIVRRLVSNKDNRPVQENSAIIRIANPDLSEDTLQLIKEYGINDDAIFFLGRLVWQGKFKNCAEPLINIVLDFNRGIYARRASARAVMACGSNEHKQRLWENINNFDDPIPRNFLADLVNEAEPNIHSIESLLKSLGKLPPYEQYNYSGLEDSLYNFFERIPFDDNQQTITRLLDGIYAYLEKPPFIQERECCVSKEFAWILNPVIHVIERLVEKRSELVFSSTIQSILLIIPFVKLWWNDHRIDQNNNLHSYIPDWPEFNDVLYWASIEQERSKRTANSGKSLPDVSYVYSLGHYWDFDTKDINRLLNFIQSRPLQDDRLIALNTAFRVYVKADKPEYILTLLNDAVANDSTLQHILNILLNPPVSETVRKFEEKNNEYQLKRKEMDERKQQERDTWIIDLRANPDRICNPQKTEPGIFTGDHFHLTYELLNYNSATKTSKYAIWKSLIPDFGEAVACAYRETAINHWRHYNLPILWSEGAVRNRTPYSLIFANIGLQIESTEDSAFPRNLGKNEIQQALRFITSKLNGFPNWLERMHHTFPAEVEKAIIEELRWELENTTTDEPEHYILSDIVHYAPWLHVSVALTIIEWIETHQTPINNKLHHCRHILTNSNIDRARLAELVNLKIAQTNDPDSIAWWYTFLIDCDPSHGIQNLEKWLSDLDDEVAVHAAQVFITTLMGDNHVSCAGCFQKVEYLKSLYLLMHRYIQAKEDIKRTNNGVYSPKLRDKAQDARNNLFNLITKVPGKESYIVMKQLEQKHPDPDYRPWMAKQAYKRAEEDGNLELWSVKQVSEFNKDQLITPTTHRQLFDLGVHRLIDLKNWLERGNDSPWKTWKLANEETDMRTLIAGWLNNHCRNQYTTAQEPELANKQRMDIWLHNTSVHSPVPIELKILDKKWTGPKLCERLSNQLAGDYLREESAKCGIMFLVLQDEKSSEKRWTINKHRVKLTELADALKCYWQRIAPKFPGVDDISVIVIDLTQRAKVSGL